MRETIQICTELFGTGRDTTIGEYPTICINRRILCRFQPFLQRSFILISLKSGPLRARFCQFAQSASLFVSRSAIAPKIKVRSRAKSERAISKSDVPSSADQCTQHTEVMWPNSPIFSVNNNKKGLIHKENQVPISPLF